MKQRPGVLKRQREIARMAKQQEKREKREQRKLDRAEGVAAPPEEQSEEEPAG